MMRTVLLALALIVLVLIGLFYMGVLSWGGGNQPIQANPVNVKMETRTVNVQVPVVQTVNSAEPAPAPAAPANTAQPAQ